jgi:hypothetical protein
VEDREASNFIGIALYVLAFMFLVGDVMAITFAAPHLSGEERYRAGILCLSLGSAVAGAGWCMRLIAHRASRK